MKGNGMTGHDFCALILAAGKGTRMKSDLVKVLHSLEGEPLLHYSIAAAKTAGAKKIVVIVGHQSDLVKEKFAGSGIVFVEQSQQLGTGHAVLQAKEALKDYSGLTAILCGDVPLLKPETISGLVQSHKASGAKVTVLTTCPLDHQGYGRIVKDVGGNILKIVEERDASNDEKRISEINTGIYCVNTTFLFYALWKITNNNQQREYYLTDIVEIARREGFGVRSHISHDYIELMGINTPEELARAALYMQNDRKKPV
jgi:UDP-N-acetylglucosamine diphosphorylase/glucosamine-1-phosphate N-acetyltransferase